MGLASFFNFIFEKKNCKFWFTCSGKLKISCLLMDKFIGYLRLFLLFSRTTRFLLNFRYRWFWLRIQNLWFYLHLYYRFCSCDCQKILKNFAVSLVYFFSTHSTRREIIPKLRLLLWITRDQFARPIGQDSKSLSQSLFNFTFQLYRQKVESFKFLPPQCWTRTKIIF